MDIQLVNVGRANPAHGEECEFGGCENRGLAYWTIPNGSGYRVACRLHARELVEESVESGDIYDTTKESK